MKNQTNSVRRMPFALVVIMLAVCSFSARTEAAAQDRQKLKVGEAAKLKKAGGNRQKCAAVGISPETSARADCAADAVPSPASSKLPGSASNVNDESEIPPGEEIAPKAKAETKTEKTMLETNKEELASKNTGEIESQEKSLSDTNRLAEDAEDTSTISRRLIRARFRYQPTAEQDYAPTDKFPSFKPDAAPKFSDTDEAADAGNDRAGKNPSDTKGEDKFHWTPALVQSGLFLAMQHGFRFTEEKTRRELDGPFFRDWRDSVKNLRGWDDGGKFFTNYVAHPLQGAITGRIFVNNSDHAKRQEFGKSREYWESRLRTMAWSAVWSTQFEIGPISEASLGNVGQTFHSDGRSKLTWIDLIITPVVGTGFVVVEDAIDKYVLKNWLERGEGNNISFKIKMLRTFLTPTTSFSNLLRARAPWRRDTRPN